MARLFCIGHKTCTNNHTIPSQSRQTISIYSRISKLFWSFLLNFTFWPQKKKKKKVKKQNKTKMSLCKGGEHCRLEGFMSSMKSSQIQPTLKLPRRDL